jgi:hypothetical protein
MTTSMQRQNSGHLHNTNAVTSSSQRGRWLAYIKQLAGSAHAQAWLGSTTCLLGFPHAPRARAIAIAADICMQQSAKLVSM